MIRIHIYLDTSKSFDPGKKPYRKDFATDSSITDYKIYNIKYNYSENALKTLKVDNKDIKQSCNWIFLLTGAKGLKRS